VLLPDLRRFVSAAAVTPLRAPELLPAGVVHFFEGETVFSLDCVMPCLRGVLRQFGRKYSLPSKEIDHPRGQELRGARKRVTAAADTSGASSGQQHLRRDDGQQLRAPACSRIRSSRRLQRLRRRLGAMASADRTFVVKAAQIGLAEVQTGELASPRHRPIRQAVRRSHGVDHTKKNDELKQIVSSSRWTCRRAAAKDQATLKKLQRFCPAQPSIARTSTRRSRDTREPSAHSSGSPIRPVIRN